MKHPRLASYQNVTFVQGDLLDPDNNRTLEEKLKECGTVVHLVGGLSSSNVLNPLLARLHRNEKFNEQIQNILRKSAGGTAMYMLLHGIFEPISKYHE